MNVEKVKVSSIKMNPDNPRVIKDNKFETLVKSIKEFPEMLDLRPIVVDENMITLGGNMRLKAIQELGIKEVSIVKVNDLTEQQKREFIVKDNLSYGEWNWDMIKVDWNLEELSDWGMDIPTFLDSDFDLGGFFDEDAENDRDNKPQNKKLIIEYSEADFEVVMKSLNAINKNTSKALWNALKLNETNENTSNN